VRPSAKKHVSLNLIAGGWNMKIRTALALAGVLAVVSSGCATQYGTVLPKEDGSYTVVTKAQTEGDALKMAQKDAESTCKKQTGNKRFVTVTHSSDYVGPEIAASKDGGMKGIAASLLEQAARANNAENFKVEMQFRCNV
jgi:hypothetical protein